jgi:hypothetical protein
LIAYVPNCTSKGNAKNSVEDLFKHRLMGAAGKAVIEDFGGRCAEDHGKAQGEDRRDAKQKKESMKSQHDSITFTKKSPQRHRDHREQGRTG